MNNTPKEQPFKSLGQRLKVIRQKLQETMADAAGAVEIDEITLERIEQGHERPSEDILTLLISHFGMQDDDAATLWQLAGYDMPQSDDEHDPALEDRNGRPGMLVVALDPRVVYTDGMHVNAGPNGVVMSFAQLSGSPQALVTARVGMSREQARSVIRTLQTALDKTEPPQLPAGNIASKDTTVDKKDTPSEEK